MTSFACSWTAMRNGWPWQAGYAWAGGGALLPSRTPISTQCRWRRQNPRPPVAVGFLTEDKVSLAHFIGPHRVPTEANRDAGSKATSLATRRLFILQTPSCPLQ